MRSEGVRASDVGRPAARRGLRERSLSTYLLALLAVQALVLVFFTATAVDTEFEAERAATAGRASSTAATAADEIAQSLARVESSLATQAAMPAFDAVFQDPAGCALTAAGEGAFLRSQIEIVRPDGTVVCSSRKDAPAVSHAGSPWLSAAATPAVPAAVGPVRDPVTGAWSAVVAVRLVRAQGGFLVLFLDLASLGEGLADRFGTSREQAEIVVVHDGRIVARSIEPERWTGREAPDDLDRLDPVGRVYGVARMDGLNWRVHAGLADAATTAAAWSRARGRALIGVVALAVLLLGSITVRRRIAAPIESLTVAVEDASRGSETPANVPRGPAEVRRLALAFNDMRSTQISAERARVGALEREREAADRLRDLNELKDQFLAGVSHALRTPLTAVVGFAATLRNRFDALSPEATRDVVGRLHTQAARLDAVVVDLLELSGLSAGELALERTPTPLGALVRELVADLDTTGRAVDVRGDPGLVPVDADKARHAVRALVVNAVRHTPDGSPIEVSLARRADGVLVTVDDRGDGIPDELKTVIFEPFHHGAELGHAPGTGVGLALVSLVAAVHGGRAWVEDRPGGGASFRVLFPASPSAVAAEPVRP